MRRHSTSLWLLSLGLALAALSARAATPTPPPTAVIGASPTEGRAPLAVLFDASASSGAQSVLWEFGDGAISQDLIVTHIYNVAGTYTATLTVFDAGTGVDSSQVAIVVSGTGEGDLTQDMNFRLAPVAGNFRLNHTQTGRDSLFLSATFNTVDLPQQLRGLAVNFAINGVFAVNGILGDEGGFESGENRKPFVSILVSQADQQLTVIISSASLADAYKPSFDLALDGAGIVGTVSTPPTLIPVTYTFTIGAQTYSITEDYTYNSGNAAGRGQFRLKKLAQPGATPPRPGLGSIQDGFFVFSRASALENIEGTGHYFEFETFISRPMALLLQQPGIQVSGDATAGSATVTGLKNAGGLSAGMTVTGPGIAPGTTALSIAGSTLTLSQPATITQENIALVFGIGTFTFKFNDGDPVVIPFDRIKRSGDAILFDQSDRDLGGVRRFFIDTVKRQMTIRTWDLRSDVLEGGTGLPLRGQPFTAFNFTVRIDFQQPDAPDPITLRPVALQAVTATRLTRKTRDDAFWQTGRRNKKR